MNIKDFLIMQMMPEKYTLVFDNVIIHQLKKVAKNLQIKRIITVMLDKLELVGPYAGKLLDSQLFIYELKNKRPPLRLYFKHHKLTNEIYVFEFEMKTSVEKQNQTLRKIKGKISKP